MKLRCRDSNALLTLLGRSLLLVWCPRQNAFLVFQKIISV